MNQTSLPYFAPPAPQEVQYVTTTHHLFELPEIFLIASLFVFIAYWYVRVSKDREKYQHWINPNGKEVNLYKIIRICFWAYTGVVIIFGIISILQARAA